MALTFIDSVGHYAYENATEKCWTPYSYIDAPLTIDFTGGLGGRPVYRATSTNGRYMYLHRAGPNTDTSYVGARYKIARLGGDSGLIDFVSDGWMCVYVYVTATGTLRAVRPPWNGSYGWNSFGYPGMLGSMGTILGTSTATITAGSWFYLEVKCKLGDTDGAVTVWLNGEAVLTLTNIKTTVYHMIGAGGGCSGLIDMVRVGTTLPGGVSNYIGDLYLGTAETGDMRIDPHFPDANGTARDWALSEGTDEYSLLDETVPNTTDYITTDTVGNRTSVSFEPLRNSGGTIVAVQVCGYLTKMEAGPCCVTPYALIGGVRYYGSGWYPSWGSYRYFMQVWNTNPATSTAWTESAFNNAEFGVERTA